MKMSFFLKCVFSTGSPSKDCLLQKVGEKAMIRPKNLLTNEPLTLMLWFRFFLFFCDFTKCTFECMSSIKKWEEKATVAGGSQRFSTG